MNKYILEGVQNSQWMNIDALDFLDLTEKTKLHISFEAICLNVAASHGVKWQDVQHANENQTNLFVVRIITYLLIISILRCLYKMSQNEIDVFIREENAYIIDEYFAYIKLKKA
ncbi:MAG: hypothetical protein ACOVNU_05875 [Candidatus Kapaibacteriota bacterium]